MADIQVNQDYLEDYEITRYQLTEKSWLDKGILPKYIQVDFDTLWNLHPAELGKVNIYGKMMDTPRWHQSYGRSYIFSGVEHKAVPIPTELQPYLDWVNTLDYPGEFNQIFANWYENGLHNIGRHSDAETDHVKDAPIVSVTLGATRTFRLRKKQEKGIFQDVEMPNRTVMVMGGKFQTELTHEIPKITGKKGLLIGPRINLTFRQFNKK